MQCSSVRHLCTILEVSLEKPVVYIVEIKKKDQNNVTVKDFP